MVLLLFYSFSTTNSIFEQVYSKTIEEINRKLLRIGFDRIYKLISKLIWGVSYHRMVMWPSCMGVMPICNLNTKSIPTQII